jgi:SAM-dependent methyltransferase
MNMKRFITSVIAVLHMYLPAAAAQHKEPPPESIWTAERQILAVEDFPARGLILDIGGGGEGVIGQLKGRQVIAIDINKRELEDAPVGPLLKIVMDARDLKFLDGSFATATVFFTFMYIDPADHEKVFRELHRVLASGARLLIWDVVFPRLEDKKKTVAIFPFTLKLPDREINTGYGVHIPATEQRLAHFEELARKTGFTAVSKKIAQQWFFLELAKPAAAKKPLM